VTDARAEQSKSAQNKKSGTEKTSALSASILCGGIVAVDARRVAVNPSQIALPGSWLLRGSEDDLAAAETAIDWVVAVTVANGGVAAYAYDQIDQAPAERNIVSE